DENNKVAAVVSERGCPFSCSFCSTQSTYGSQVTMRSVKSLVDEIEGLVDRGVNIIADYAPTGNRDSERVHEFCEEVRKRGLDNSFSMYALWRLETPNGKPMIDESLIADLTSTLSGFKMGVGIEALSEQAQNYLHKTHSLKHLENVSGWMDKYGALFRGFYMVTPEITKESLLGCETNQVLSKFDDIRVSYLTPFPRTVIGEETKDKLITKDWSRYDCEQPVLRAENMSQGEFGYAVHDVVQGFLLNPIRRERIKEKIKNHPNLHKLYGEYDKKMAGAGFEVLRNSI
ncbi:hypothetical protein KAR91_30260, partial [Candidatus Pacearchaeota archaeon]|nr:hypothetical protein [Candidatus Pacearchaeota archaeon]